jgi:CRISPR-associated endonuclease Cas1/CRISPR-associated protein Cas4
MEPEETVTVAERDLLPVRMLNEYVYCPRLFHLMHVEGRWEDNVFTVEGRFAHRRGEEKDEVLPDPIPADKKDEASEGDPAPVIARSVQLGSARLGLIAKLDLVTASGDTAIPLETKRGRVPDNPERSWEPERVQLMAQGLLLREHGYHVDHGVLYFAGSRTRVEVPFTVELEARTLAYVEQARLAAGRTTLPPPLDNSPKCNGCSLSGICLPDETLALRQVPGDPVAPEVRRLYPPREDAVPLYVQEQGASVGKSGESLVISFQGKELARAGLKDVSQLVLCGNISVSAQTLHLLCEAAIPTVHLSMGHWFYGITFGITLRSAYNRAAQFEAAADPARRLAFSRALVRAKGANQRTMVRRNADPRPERDLGEMERMIAAVDRIESLDELLGIEGALAAIYFGGFAKLLRSGDVETDWDFKGRNRRPPKDPVNALLSFGYALLTKECTVALLAEGLDPWWGLYHRPRHGRPALALDLMEEFRPLVVDSAVVTAVNTGMVRNKNFTRSASGCVLNPAGRKAFIRAYEARLDQLVTHPVFDYRCSWRTLIRLQARFLSRWLRGDLPQYVGMTTR